MKLKQWPRANVDFACSAVSGMFALIDKLKFEYHHKWHTTRATMDGTRSLVRNVSLFTHLDLRMKSIGIREQIH